MQEFVAIEILRYSRRETGENRGRS